MADISLKSDRELIDRIVYLASLVSDVRRVDPLLDTLRTVTAYGQGSTSLNTLDRQKLVTLYKDLSNYLVEQEKIRHFTEETLGHAVEQHFSKRDPRRTAFRNTLKEFGIILGLSVASFVAGMLFLPGQAQTRTTLASLLAEAMLHIAVAWLFWSTRKALVFALQKAYGFIAAGLLVATIGSAQFPLLSAYASLTENPALQYAGFLPPFALMALLIYFGIFAFAKQLAGDARLLLRPQHVLPVALLIAVFAVILPHAAVPHRVWFDLSLASMTITAFLSFVSTVLSFTILRKITARYARGMLLFGLGQGLVAVGCLVFAAILLSTGAESGQKVALLGVPFSISQLLLLASGLSFRKNIQD